MSEVKLLGKKEATQKSSSSKFTSVGQILKHYRELKGLSLEEVSQKTYIKLKYLVSLEENSSDMPAPVYVYSYIKHYSKLLGLDGTELVKLYQKQCKINDRSFPDLNEKNLQQENVQKENLDVNNDDKSEQSFDIRKENSNNNMFDSDSVFDNNILPQKSEENSVNKEINNVNVSQANSAPKLQNNNIQNIEKPVINTPVKENIISQKVDLPQPVKTPEVFQERIQPVKQQEIVKETPVISKPKIDPGKEVEDAKKQAELIVLNAKREAERIIREAREEAYEMRNSSQSYASQVLNSLSNELKSALMEVRNGRNFLKDRLSKNHTQENQA